MFFSKSRNVANPLNKVDQTNPISKNHIHKANIACRIVSIYCFKLHFQNFFVQLLLFLPTSTALPISSFKDLSSVNLLFPLFINSLSFSWFTMDTRPPPLGLPLPLVVEVLFLLAPAAPAHTTTNRQHSTQAPRGSNNMATGPRVQLRHMAS